MTTKLAPPTSRTFTYFPLHTHHKASIFTTKKLQGSNSHVFDQNRLNKCRVFCRLSEKESSKIVNGVKLNDVDDVKGVVVSGLGDELDGKNEGVDGNWPPWKNLPQRYKLVGTTSLAFIICNMDKVNLSVAIIPMSHQFGWSSSVAGLVQSSFFWGYALSQLPGGWLSKVYGGRKVLQIGVLGWSLATAFVPVLAGFMPGLVLSRVLVGIGEGVSPSAATDLIARHVRR
ncbi:hypothetical protein Leryth_018552 [Lithospermum erythrorhizon]|nr:hypothetical protein Leryth_018552 [Lithospermum erythrorhizon]